MPTLTDTSVPTDWATGWADSGCWGLERTLTRLPERIFDASDEASLAPGCGSNRGVMNGKTTASTEGSAYSIREMASSRPHPTLRVARACLDPSRGGTRVSRSVG